MKRETIFWKKVVQIHLAEQKEHNFLLVVLDPRSLSIKLSLFFRRAQAHSLPNYDQHLTVAKNIIRFVTDLDPVLLFLAHFTGVLG